MSGGVKLWRFEVHHPDFGTVIVTGVGPDSAINAAIKRWGVSWKEEAGHCWAIKLGSAEKPRCRNCHREFGEPGSAAAYCPECEKAMEFLRREKDRYAAEHRGRDGERRRRAREE